MKRFVIAVCASVLLLAGGSGAATLDTVRPNVILKFNEIARIANTNGWCFPGIMGAKLGTVSNKRIPVIACSASKSGRPVVGSHVNLIIDWFKTGQISAIGRWVRDRGRLTVSLGGGGLWPPQDTPRTAVFTYEFPIFNQLQGKVKGKVKKVQLKKWDIFSVSGAGFLCFIQGPATDGASDNTVLCDTLSPQNSPSAGMMFWSPYGAKDLEVYLVDPACDCGAATVYRP